MPLCPDFFGCYFITKKIRYALRILFQKFELFILTKYITFKGICDGAGAVVLASESAASKHNLNVLARIVGYSIIGVEPSIMGIGPAPAIKNLLKATGKSLQDIDLIDINEAFGAQALSCAKELGLDMTKFNVDGGAIAVGHPLGASGSRITAHLIHELRQVM